MIRWLYMVIWANNLHHMRLSPDLNVMHVFLFTVGDNKPKGSWLRCPRSWGHTNRPCVLFRHWLNESKASGLWQWQGLQLATPNQHLTVTAAMCGTEPITRETVANSRAWGWQRQTEQAWGSGPDTRGATERHDHLRLLISTTTDKTHCLNHSKPVPHTSN